MKKLSGLFGIILALNTYSLQNPSEEINYFSNYEIENFSITKEEEVIGNYDSTLEEEIVEDNNPTLEEEIITTSIQTNVVSEPTQQNYQSQITNNSQELKFYDEENYDLIIISPHFDDAVFSVGGILAEYQSNKTIITIFNSPEYDIGHLTYWDNLSGFNNNLNSNIINLDFLDNQYRNNSINLTQNIIQNLENIFQNYENALIIGPSYFGENFTHIDHKIVSDAFIQIALTNQNENLRFYLYEDLPYTYNRFGFNNINLDLILNQHYGIELNQHIIEISSTSLEDKLEASNAHTSQIFAFNNYGHDILRNLEYYARNRNSTQEFTEVLYEIKTTNFIN